MKDRGWKLNLIFLFSMHSVGHERKKIYEKEKECVILKKMDYQKNSTILVTLFQQNKLKILLGNKQKVWSWFLYLYICIYNVLYLYSYFANIKLLNTYNKIGL